MFNEIPSALEKCIGYLAIDFANDGRQYEKIHPEHFGAIGFADGYADFESDREAMEDELKRRGTEMVDIDYSMYLYDMGYEAGKFMSDNADILYDEDGELKEEWDL